MSKTHRAKVTFPAVVVTCTNEACAHHQFNGLTQFLANLGSRNLWLGVGKVVVGIALIIVGLVHLTHAGNIVADVAKGAVLA